MYSSHGSGVLTALKAGNKVRVLTTFPDATEMVEEYDAMIQDLECRRWRSTRPLGGTGDWEYEIGDPPKPTFHPRDYRKAWEWKFRNLPYPEDIYNVTVDGEKQELVLRTTNRKYFKRFKIPVLVRMEIALEASKIKFAHDGKNTLVVSYGKPAPVIEEERKARSKAKESQLHGF